MKGKDGWEWNYNKINSNEKKKTPQHTTFQNTAKHRICCGRWHFFQFFQQNRLKVESGKPQTHRRWAKSNGQTMSNSRSPGGYPIVPMEIFLPAKRILTLMPTDEWSGIWWNYPAFYDAAMTTSSEPPTRVHMWEERKKQSLSSLRAVAYTRRLFR